MWSPCRWEAQKWLQANVTVSDHSTPVVAVGLCLGSGLKPHWGTVTSRLLPCPVSPTSPCCARGWLGNRGPLSRHFSVNLNKISSWDRCSYVAFWDGCFSSFSCMCLEVWGKNPKGRKRRITPLQPCSFLAVGSLVVSGAVDKKQVQPAKPRQQWHCRHNGINDEEFKGVTQKF